MGMPQQDPDSYTGNVAGWVIFFFCLLILVFAGVVLNAAGLL
jgi:hypothetical protein